MSSRGVKTTKRPNLRLRSDRVRTAWERYNQWSEELLRKQNEMRATEEDRFSARLLFLQEREKNCDSSWLFVYQSMQLYAEDKLRVLERDCQAIIKLLDDFQDKVFLSDLDEFEEDELQFNLE